MSILIMLRVLGKDEILCFEKEKNELEDRE